MTIAVQDDILSLDRPKHVKKFMEYVKNNPQSYKLFRRFALNAIKAGCKKLSAGFIVERMRWESRVIMRDNDGFKISNDHRTLFSRLFLTEFPEHRAMFELKGKLSYFNEEYSKTSLHMDMKECLREWWSGEIV